MDRLIRTGRRAAEFLWGDFGGAPVAYLVAIAAIYTAMVVLVVRDFLGQG